MSTSVNDINEILDFSDFLRVDNFNVVCATSCCHDAVHADVGGEMLELTTLGEVEVESHFFTAVWMQRHELTLHVLG